MTVTFFLLFKPCIFFAFVAHVISDNALCETIREAVSWHSSIEYLEGPRKERQPPQFHSKKVHLSGLSILRVCLKIVRSEILKLNLKISLFLGNVRVVLFRECDKKGKKLLFDSSTVEKVRLCPEKENKDTIFTELTDGWGFKYLQPPSKDVR